MAVKRAKLSRVNLKLEDEMRMPKNPRAPLEFKSQDARSKYIKSLTARIDAIKAQRAKFTTGRLRLYLFCDFRSTLEESAGLRRGALPSIRSSAIARCWQR